MNEKILDLLEKALLSAQKYLATMIFKPPVVIDMTPFIKFCNFIEMYEGAEPANNNPYDFRYYFGGYLPKYGVVKESTGGFAMFETLALGVIYGQTCITEMIQNHPNQTFLDFFKRFAPSDDDNNPELYALAAAKVFSVDSSATLKQTLNM